MNTISPVSELLGGNSAGARPASSVEDMGSDDFLQLMVAQLQNQDPTKPMDNMQFMSELAQFGTVSGIQELNQGFSDLAGNLLSAQNMQAVSMVGRNVMVDGNVGLLQAAEPGVDGAATQILEASVTLPQHTTSATVFIEDLAGRVVHSAPLTELGGGQQAVRWDGLDVDGNALPPGAYRVSAEAMIDGETQALSVFAHQRVDSVSLDPSSGAVQLNLADGQSIGMKQVLAFL